MHLTTRTIVGCELVHGPNSKIDDVRMPCFDVDTCSQIEHAAEDRNIFSLCCSHCNAESAIRDVTSHDIITTGVVEQVPVVHQEKSGSDWLTFAFLGKIDYFGTSNFTRRDA